MLFICDEKGCCKSKEHYKNKTETTYILIQFIFVYHHIVAGKQDSTTSIATGFKIEAVF